MRCCLKILIATTFCILILIPSLLCLRFYRQGTARHEAGISAVPEEPVAPRTVFEPVVSPPAFRATEDSRELSAWDALYPDFYAPQPYAATKRAANTVYLTFDDGPSSQTDEVLRILAEKDVRATFFVTGTEDPADLERMRGIVEAGHTIGMHSYSHDYAAVYASVEDFLDEFNRNFCQIREATGVSPTVYRFPGGSINGYDGGFFREILSEMTRRGFVPFDWNISGQDAVHSVTAEAMAQNVIAASAGKTRCFVLLHDGHPNSVLVKALGMMIDRLREAGWEFAAITPDTLPVLYSL